MRIATSNIVVLFLFLFLFLAIAGVSCRASGAHPNPPQAGQGGAQGVAGSNVIARQPPAAPSPRPVRTTKFAPVKPGENAAAEIQKAFAEPLDVQVGKSRTPGKLRSCADYLALGTTDVVTPSPPDQQTLDELIGNCEALKMISLAQPSMRTFLDGFKVDKRAVAVLPAAFYLDMSPDEEEALKKAAPVGRSWKSFDPKAHAAKNDWPHVQLHVEGNGYGANVSEFARGDFDHDGVEDLLIRRFAWPEGGSATDYTNFLVTKTSETSPMRAVTTWRSGS